MGLFRIPEYQRAYASGTRQTEDLFHDISDITRSKREHFMALRVPHQISDDLNLNFLPALISRVHDGVPHSRSGLAQFENSTFELSFPPGRLAIR